MNDWYYRSNGLRRGPVTTDQIREMVNTGRLGPNAELRRVDRSNWRAIRDIPGLREQADAIVREQREGGPRTIDADASDTRVRIADHEPSLGDDWMFETDDLSHRTDLAGYDTSMMAEAQLPEPEGENMALIRRRSAGAGQNANRAAAAMGLAVLGPVLHLLPVVGVPMPGLAGFVAFGICELLALRYAQAVLATCRRTRAREGRGLGRAAWWISMVLLGLWVLVMVVGLAAGFLGLGGGEGGA